MKKRILSMLLVIALMLTCLPTHAFAFDSNTNELEVETADGGELSIQASEESTVSGIPAVTIKQHNCNGDLVQSVTFNETGTELIVTDFATDGTSRISTIKIADRVAKTVTGHTALNALSGSWLTTGYITYNRLFPTDLQEQIRVQHMLTSSDNEAYTINGKATDTLAVIVGLVASVLSVVIKIPAAWNDIATALVSGALGALGGGAIGVFFSEDVAVNASYYDMRGYDYSTDRYSMEYSGIARKVTTSNSPSFDEWYYEEFTPFNWQHNTLALWFWNDLWATSFPGVSSYS